MQSYDIAVVGGGIVGLATARALAAGGLSVVVLEAEDGIARHQTGHNSGVIHSGLYYKPGSLKAKTCTEGREALYRYCAERGIPYERCGKVVVATEEAELPALAELERRGRANGLEGMVRLEREDIAEYEPHATGVAGLFVPQTGIVDYLRVADGFAEDVRRAGGEIRTGWRVLRVDDDGSGVRIESSSSAVHCSHVVNCAGLQSDRLARLCGVDPGARIVPFRGDYFEIRPERRHLVRNLIYPVPDPRFPFLGVHFTRTIDGGVEAGPNAVLALERDRYSRFAFSLRDTASVLSFGGFWKIATQYYRTGLGEIRRSFSQRAFVAALRRLVPEIQVEDVVRGGCGIRAQAVSADGKLVDDFRTVEGERSTHVINAPSPAATAAIPIGEEIARRVRSRWPPVLG